MKESNYGKALELSKKIHSPELSVLFKHKVKYLTEGVRDSIQIPEISNEFTGKEKAVYYILLGDYYKVQRNKMNQFINYNLSYKIAVEENNKLLLNASLKRLIEYEIYNERTIDTLDAVKWLKELKQNREDQLDDFWCYYRAIQVKFFIKDYKLDNRIIDSSDVSSYKRKEISDLFYELKKNAEGNIYHSAMYYQLLSIYQADWLNKFELSDINAIKAGDFYDQLPYQKVKDKAKGVEFNRAVNLFKAQKYEEAIPIFKRNLNRENLPNLYKEYTYDWLVKSYEAIDDSEKALFYLKKYDSIIKIIHKTSKSVGIYKRDEIIKDKEKTIQEKKQLKKSNLLSWSIVGFTLLFLILTFYLYKRYKKKSSVLEEEKTETLQEIAELKSIVIKNHIVLKDKTKVYVADLMYVKSDDHYLRIYTQDNKDRMVRGKLSQIKAELPPNFIQCHRSYIVNSNFIKQINSNYILLINKEEIPLSRSYKDKF